MPGRSWPGFSSGGIVKKSEVVLSPKLAKQMKDLEVKPKHVAFRQLLDEVFKRIR